MLCLVNLMFIMKTLYSNYPHSSACIYKCKLNNTKPSLDVFKAKLIVTLNIEFLIAKRNGNLLQHYRKWDFLNSILIGISNSPFYQLLLFSVMAFKIVRNKNPREDSGHSNL